MQDIDIVKQHVRENWIYPNVEDSVDCVKIRLLDNYDLTEYYSPPKCARAGDYEITDDVSYEIVRLSPVRKKLRVIYHNC